MFLLSPRSHKRRDHRVKKAVPLSKNLSKPTRINENESPLKTILP